ncbi:MAG: hypothetical protein Q9222_003295 [Ikaeria aurantiellina]
MHRYRIGRISEDWVNLTPPIRGGSFKDTANASSIQKPSTPTNRTKLPFVPFSTNTSPFESDAYRSLSCHAEDGRKDDKVVVTSRPPREPGNAEMVKQALDKDIDQYPSLDAQTQRAIVERYRELHQRIKKEGYYDCQYWEYVKEMTSIPTWPLRIVFVLVSHIITMPLHVQITLSHWSMSTSDVGEGESFPQHQLRTTMDVECPSWLDPLHGGLQFQAVHHLFPGVPRHNLRRLQQLVIKFCEETGIKYKRLGFVAGNRDVLGKLGEVAAQLDLMIKCQKHMAETGKSGLH